MSEQQQCSKEVLFRKKKEGQRWVRRKERCLGMCDFVLITVQPGGADTLPGAAGGGAGDRSCAGSTFAAADEYDHQQRLLHVMYESNPSYLIIIFSISLKQQRW